MDWRELIKRDVFVVKASRGDLEGLKQLVSSGVDVNFFDGEETALYAAAKRGHADVVEYLLSVGADYKIKVEDEFGEKESPLVAAAKNGHGDVVGILLNAGAGEDAEQLSAANKAGHLFMVQALTKGRDICAFPSYGGREYLDMVAKDDRIDEQLQFFNYSGDALQQGLSKAWMRGFFSDPNDIDSSVWLESVAQQGFFPDLNDIDLNDIASSVLREDVTLEGFLDKVLGEVVIAPVD